MNSSETTILNAFVAALHQLDEPLPPNVQTHLNEVGKQIETNPKAIAYLEAVAPQYPPLDRAYTQAKMSWQADTRDLRQDTPNSSELDETNRELMNRAIAIFQASNSVDATQTAIAQDRKGGLQRLVAFFKKSSSNA